MKTTVHEMAPRGQKCIYCKAEIPPGPQGQTWKPGEFIGVNTSEVIPLSSAYRIGTNNKESMCNGSPYTEFRQDSNDTDVKDLQDTCNGR